MRTCWNHSLLCLNLTLFFVCFINWSLVCFSACPRWTHGAGCSKECDCVQEHSSGCDPKTGSCFCKAAYHGPQCEEGISTSQNTNSLIQRQLQHPWSIPHHQHLCLAPFYPLPHLDLQNCTQFWYKCPKQKIRLRSFRDNLHWSLNQADHHLLGIVLHNVGSSLMFIFSCSVYVSLIPLVECDPGFFGAGCEQPCDCPGGGSCDPRTGECSQRCPAGRQGDRCQLGETMGWAI